MVTWSTIADSPAVQAVQAVIQAVPVAPALPRSFNVLEFVESETMPIENLRAQLDRHGMPDGRFRGEDFERKVYRDRYQYFSLRNTAAGVNLLVADLKAAYILGGWTEDAQGRRVGIELCVTPNLSAASGAGWTDFLQRWIVWMLPYFAGAVTIVICVEEHRELTVSPGFGSVMTQVVEVS